MEWHDIHTPSSSGIGRQKSRREQAETHGQGQKAGWLNRNQKNEMGQEQMRSATGGQSGKTVLESHAFRNNLAKNKCEAAV